ncbi:MAG: AgmX/PglI C-terminal domain-containing protein [Myxococcales bacterium]|nr:AgmX/PglI C-terminal domain-containing protein [Myxococcales bacterium]
MAVWFGMQSCEEPAPVAPVAEAAMDAGVEAPPVIEDPNLILPDELPDSALPDAGTRIRYVTRYVGGGGGSWSCAGDIDQAAASRAVAANNLQFRNCYERRLKVNQTLSGRITLQVRVGRDGAATGVRTGGSLNDPEVASCVRAIAQRIRFPRPTGGCAVVAVPFDFTPQN